MFIKCFAMVNTGKYINTFESKPNSMKITRHYLDIIHKE